MTTFTDHEQRFADSPRGRMLVAQAQREHRMREAYKGNAARPWTDAMAADAVRSLATQEARSTVIATAAVADNARQLADARVIRDCTLVARKDRLRNAWRGK